MRKYYLADSNTPPMNKLLCAIGGALIVFGLGYVHGLITAVNPIIYLGFVVTAGFGILFAIFYRIISKITKVRDKGFIVISGLAIALLGLYFSWGSYVLYLAEASEEYVPSIGLLTDPVWMFGVISSLYTDGSWGFGLSNPAIVRGPILGFIWLAEIAAVLYLVHKTLAAYELGPFSESRNRWYTKYTLGLEFQSLGNEDIFHSLLATTVFDKIGELNNGNATRFGRISLFTLEGSTSSYLLYENVGRDRKGKREEATCVIEHLLLPADEAKKIIAKYYGKKQFYFEY